jgi:uncharacterized OsmC-like protein
MEQIREAIEGARAYLGEHPDEARYTDSSATASIESGLRVRVLGPAGEVITTDMPRAVGGGGAGPTPGWLSRAAVAACVASLLAMRGAVARIDVIDAEVIVESESDDRGILGLDDSVPAGPLSARIVIRYGAATWAAHRRDRLEDLARWAVDHCPASEALGRAVPVVLEVT